MSPEQREGVALTERKQELQLQRRAQVRQLIAVIADDASWTSEPATIDRCIAATELLGDWRAEEAIEVLVPHLAFMKPNPGLVGLRPSGLEDFPVAVALRKIGIRSLPPVLRAVARGDTNLIETSAANFMLHEWLPLDVVKVFAGVVKGELKTEEERTRLAQFMGKLNAMGR